MSTVLPITRTGQSAYKDRKRYLWLLSVIAQRNDTLDQVLTEFPPLIQHFADTRDLFADAVQVDYGNVQVLCRSCDTASRQSP